MKITTLQKQQAEQTIKHYCLIEFKNFTWDSEIIIGKIEDDLNNLLEPFNLELIEISQHLDIFDIDNYLENKPWKDGLLRLINFTSGYKDTGINYINQIGLIDNGTYKEIWDTIEDTLINVLDAILMIKG